GALDIFRARTAPVKLPATGVFLPE
ncbi:MAG: hypothetical protein J07HQW1_00212, partial [Haloquadratum walsbyi J07HQW1]